MFDALPDLRLSLKTVLGTTTLSPNCFDCIPHASSFATCAGSVAVLTNADEDFNLTHKFFRSNSTASTIHSGSQFESSSAGSRVEARSRQVPSLNTNVYETRVPGTSPTTVGSSPRRINQGRLRQRTRAISCVSLSANGKYLAVGETGYTPQILLYTVSPNSSSFPCSALAKHTSGVRCISFSPDSCWLCSVGDIHDGFIFLWAVNAKTGGLTLVASNKCTSIIHDVKWISGETSGGSIVSVGVRHVKVWRPEQSMPSSPQKSKFRSDPTDSSVPPSPSSKTLYGRNTLLGPLLEATFTCVAAISNQRAVACTDRGDVCVLDDSQGAQRLYRVLRVRYGIKCLTIDTTKEFVWIGGNKGEVQKLPYAAFSASESVERNFSPSKPDIAFVSPTGSPPIALGLLRNRLLSIDSERTIRLHGGLEDKGCLTASKCFQAHSSAVLGLNILRALNSKPTGLMSWDTKGLVIFWSLTGKFEAFAEVPLEQLPPSDEIESNRLRVIRPSSGGRFYVSGDRYGTLRLLEREWQACQAINSHQGEINDIAIQTLDEQTTVVASCGRDRTVQLYSEEKSTLSLLQTIDQHGSSVDSLCFLDGGNLLVSSSSDRTIMVSSLAENEGSIAFIPARAIALKQSPISMSSSTGEPGLLLVTTMDKQLHRFMLHSGQLISSTRLVDDATSVLLSSITAQTVHCGSTCLRVIIGVSATDKSVRIHDAKTGATLLKDYGHSEGVSDVAIITHEISNTTSKYTIISTGLEGTVMLWELEYSQHLCEDQPATTSPSSEMPRLLRPVRRVLSRSALAEFSRILNEDGDSPTPTRNQSPTRLRKNESENSLFGKSSKIITPNSNAPNRSSSPSRLATSLLKERRPQLSDRSGVHLVNDLKDMSYSTNQLLSALRDYRARLSILDDPIDSDMAIELEKQLELTMKAIKQKQ